MTGSRSSTRLYTASSRFMQCSLLPTNGPNASSIFSTPFSWMIDRLPLSVRELSASTFSARHVCDSLFSSKVFTTCLVTFSAPSFFITFSPASGLLPSATRPSRHMFSTFRRTSFCHSSPFVFFFQLLSISSQIFGISDSSNTSSSTGAAASASASPSGLALLSTFSRRYSSEQAGFTTSSDSG